MLKIDNIHFDILFDKYGNVYLKNNDIYQLNIDGENVPYFDTYNYEIIDNITTKSTFEYSQKLFPCSGDSPYKLNDKDEDDIIYPDIEEKYGYHNKPFKFYNNLDNVKICNIKDSDICALYDTFVYKDNKLRFISRSPDESSAYEVCIYDNNDILFKLLGEKDVYYTITLNSNLFPILNLKDCP